MLFERGMLPIAVEAAVVGLVTLVISAVLDRYRLVESKYAAWFLVGVITHVGFEAMGYNESWCRSTYYS